MSRLRSCASGRGTGDLLSAAWAYVAGAVGVGFTIAAMVSAVRGYDVTTPWLIVGAVASLLVIVFMAYTRAARERDDLKAQNPTGADVSELRARLTELEAGPRMRIDADGVPYFAHGDDPIQLRIDGGFLG